MYKSLIVGSLINWCVWRFILILQATGSTLLLQGLQSMVNHAFDHRREFLLLDDLPTAQFIYNSARNIETAAYLLRTKRTTDGKPYLYADGIQIRY